jgi:hypothetical protein
MTMNTSTQYGTISGLTGNGTVTAFVRRSGVPAATGTIFAISDPAANQRSLLFAEDDAAADAISLRRNPDGTATPLEIYGAGASSWAATQACYVVQWIAGGGRGLWINKTSTTITLRGGTAAQTQRFAVSLPIVVNAAISGGSPLAFAGGDYVALLIIANVTPSDTQRDTLSDLMNAL